MSQTRTRNLVCELRWDTTDPHNPGWHATVVDREWDTVVNDSAKVHFPVDVDAYGASEGQRCAKAIARALRVPVTVQLNSRTVVVRP